MTETPHAETVVVCCIESGPLEDQTVRMIRSLRRWGGWLAQAPVLAVTSRPGPRLDKSTRLALQAAEAEHIILDPDPTHTPWIWNKFLNKPRALLNAAQTRSCDTLIWLDSDTLVTAPPEELRLADHEDFTASAPDKNVGTAGPEDENEPYWQSLCSALNLDITTLPVVTTTAEQQTIRMYFNSGVFAFRRQSGLARAFYAGCLSILKARIASRNAGIFFLDQVALGLTVHALGLHWRMASTACNHTLGSRIVPLPEEDIARAAVLHYHDSLWPQQWPHLLTLLTTHRPDVADWLRGQGPMRNPATLPRRLLSKTLGAVRGRQEQAYIRTCTTY